MGIGRTGVDVRFGVAGAADNFIVGTAQGDAVIYMLADKALWLGANSVLQQKISSLGTQCKTGLYPPDDDGAVQAAVKIHAGNGVPDNANGANGDFYLRGDGTTAGSTVIYHKEGGAWVPAVTF